ncbi:MAG: MoxR family ATPase [Actinomycetota bacterium]
MTDQDVSAAPAATGTPTPRPTFSELFGRVVGNVERVIQGKRTVVEQALVCLVAEGHLLVEDVPGVGKTSLAKALAGSISGSFGRIQFTPDVLPSDVVGVSVWDRSTDEFRFRQGPVFNNLVLADEVNRASPKTQSALLEAMEERQVTVDGRTYPLDAPFMVVATQNPIDHEGTYPLPESQLDRFFMRISMGYPSRDAALEILTTHGADSAGSHTVDPVVSVGDVIAMTKAARTIHVAPSLQRYIVEIAEATRQHPALALGISPRATLALQRAGRALAAARSRDYVVPDDLRELAVPVLAHRVGLTPEARLQGLDAGDVITEVLRAVPVPTSAEA